MMATKKTQPATNNTLKVKRDSEKSADKQFAEIGLSTTVLNSTTASSFTKSIIGEIDVTEAIAVMKEKVSKVNAGDLTGLEATLTAQVTSLDTIFNALARRANNSDTMSKLEVYMRLALKAQAQCARTIEVLAAMKNPPIVFAKQANITNGNQQINNGSLTSNSHAHAGKNINQSNELLETQHHGEWMDNGKKTTTSGTDTAMATVETLNRG
jgi:hypothetical protein